MRRALAAVVVALVLPAAAGAQPGVGVKAKTGKGLYAAYCLSCHGVDGSGVTSDTQPRGVLDLRGLGPPLKGVGALAADFYLTTGYMPIEDPHDQPRHTKSPFDKREIAALVAYVASFGKGPGVPHPQPERGEISRGLSCSQSTAPAATRSSRRAATSPTRSRRRSIRRRRCRSQKRSGSVPT